MFVFEPALTDVDGAMVPNLRPGFLHCAPDGNAGGFPAGASFDRDYAGGGPTFADRDTGTVIQYRGEYHRNYPAAQPFDTSLGLAISSDSARTFAKLGLAIRPEIPPDQPIPPSATIPTVPSSSGSLVTAGAFFYLYYSDLSPDGTCAGRTSALKNLPCIAVALAQVADVITAARHGWVAPWRKYNRGGFVGPGIGGRFSPLIVTDGRSWVRWPAVRYDPAAGRFLMTDVLVESGPLLRTTAPREINYPSILTHAEEHLRPKTGMPWSAIEDCTSIDVLFVLEEDTARLGAAFTRDIDAVSVSFNSRR